MFQLDLEKSEELEIKLPTFAGSWKNKRVPEKHLFLFYFLGKTLLVFALLHSVFQGQNLPVTPGVA